MSNIVTRRQLLTTGLAMGLPGMGWAADAAPPAVSLPDVLDFRALLTPARDQGYVRDTCAAFAVTAAFEAVLARDTGRPQALSEEFLTQVVRIGQRPPFSEFVDLQSMMSVSQYVGMVPAAVMPYRDRISPGKNCRPKGQTGPACHAVTAPPGALMAHAQRLRASDWRACGTKTAEKLMKNLIRFRTPIIVTMKMPQDYAGWADNGMVTSVPKLLRLPNEALEAVPNHFVVVSGYDRRRQLFYFKNSWSTQWGDNGFGRISFADIATKWNSGVGFYLKGVVIT